MKKKHKTFFDEELRLVKLDKQGDPLKKLKNLVNWEIFRNILTKACKKKSIADGGRPNYDYVMMFKILILQRYYNLSDTQTEFQISDRLTFMRFLDLGLEDSIPDEKTIWNFKNTLIKKDKIKTLFNKFNVELKKKKVFVNEGSIIDASFVDVPIQRNSKDDNKSIKDGEIPKGFIDEKNKLAQKDVDARWMTKNKERHFGYKNHINIDKKSKLIKTYCITDASTHDSQAVEGLLTKDDKWLDLYADSAYSGKPIKKILKRKSIEDKIHEKGYRNKPLTENQKNRNKRKSKIRARVEHVFGFVENSMGGSFIRSIGRKRAEGNIGLMNITYNIFRSLQLQSV